MDELIGNPLDIWDEGWDVRGGKPVYDFCMIYTWPFQLYRAPGDWYDDYEGTLIAIGEHTTLTPPVIPQFEDD